jgi:hypothetical protein
VTSRVAWRPQVLVERVLNADYVKGVDRTGLRAQLEMRYLFPR